MSQKGKKRIEYWISSLGNSKLLAAGPTTINEAKYIINIEDMLPTWSQYEKKKGSEGELAERVSEYIKKGSLNLEYSFCFVYEDGIRAAVIVNDEDSKLVISDIYLSGKKYIEALTKVLGTCIKSILADGYRDKKLVVEILDEQVDIILGVFDNAVTTDKQNPSFTRNISIDTFDVYAKREMEKLIKLQKRLEDMKIETTLVNGTVNIILSADQSLICRYDMTRGDSEKGSLIVFSKHPIKNDDREIFFYEETDETSSDYEKEYKASKLCSMEEYEATLINNTVKWLGKYGSN